MLSEEEKNAIEILENLSEYGLCYNITEEHQEVIKIVLNFISKLQKENKKLKDKNKDLLRKLRNRVKEVKKLTKYSLYKKEFSTLNKIIKEKDKQIDLMALTLSNVCTGIPSIIEQFEKEYCEFINSNEDCCWKTDKNCQDCIKQYFEKQAKEKGD